MDGVQAGAARQGVGHHLQAVLAGSDEHDLDVRPKLGEQGLRVLHRGVDEHDLVAARLHGRGGLRFRQGRVVGLGHRGGRGLGVRHVEGRGTEGGIEHDARLERHHQRAGGRGACKGGRSLARSARTFEP